MGAETPQSIPAVTDADGVSYDFALTAAQSSALTVGKAHYTIRGINAALAQTATIAYGAVLVRPDPSKAVDRRSQNEINLAAVEAGIAARMSGTIMNEYVINGMTVKMPPLEKLLEIRATLQAEVKREKGKLAQRAIPIRLSPDRGGYVPFSPRRFR